MLTFTPQNSNQNPQALRGFWKWLGRAVQNVANAVIEVARDPTFVFNIIQDAADGGGFTVGNPSQVISFMPAHRTLQTLQTVFEDIPLTEYEETLLDNWVENHFIQRYKSYFASIKDFDTRQTSLEEFIAFYNDVQKYIGLVTWYKGYVVANGEPGLSTNAILARNQFLTAQMDLLQAEIIQYMYESEIDVVPVPSIETISTVNYSYLGFSLPDTATINAYKLMSNGFQVTIPATNSGNNNTASVPVKNDVNDGSKPGKGTGTIFLGLGIATLLGIGIYRASKSEGDDENED